MLLRTSGLTKRFGGLTAVDHVDFAIDEGELVSLIGPNGAGKTTFFNLLTGVLSPSDGRIEYQRDGEMVDMTDHEPHEAALAGIHRSYQITNVFPQATVLENVRIAAQAHGGADSWKLHRNVDDFGTYEAAAYEVLERVGLADAADQPAHNLSHGQKRNLEVGIALAGDPDVLLLDEPTAGVASDGIDRIVSLIEDVAADHAILLVEHNMDVVMGLSDRVAVLNQGSLIADSDPQAVRDDPAVQEAYLGGYDPDGGAGGPGSAGDHDDAGPDGDHDDAGPDGDRDDAGGVTG
jgi:branched-chain amino acid transport system ATP-binding protein